jgi:hypothetical protein
MMATRLVPGIGSIGWRRALDAAAQPIGVKAAAPLE